MSGVGIIGFGRFGELATRYLSQDFAVVVYTRSDNGVAVKNCGAMLGSLQPLVVRKR
jgi:prephenate dehydrogenase